MKWFKKRFIRSWYIPIVRLDGVIGSSGQFGGGGLTDVSLASVLEKAFEMPRIKAVALIINSPGGSPTQSSLIAARIKRLSEINKVPVIAFCEDVAASGGYWLACAADEIFADENSIVGSIGVISASFGFHEFINRQGIERRVYTAGEDKSVLDPFRPENQEDIVKIKKIQTAIHENFQNYVKASRGEKIHKKSVCTGEFWDARKALDLGLIDGIGHLEPVLKERYGDKIEFKIISRKKPLFARLSKSMINSVIGAYMSKLYFARFNL
jgi:serine protease SohB